MPRGDIPKFLIAEVDRAISFLEGVNLVSRPRIEGCIVNGPDQFPNLAAMDKAMRRQVITKVMNSRFPRLPSTGRKPKGHVWVLGGGVCATA